MKIFTHQVKINFKDDLPKVIAFFKSHGIDISFETPVETDISLKDAPVGLYLPHNSEGILMYVYDRSEFFKSFCLNFSPTLQVLEVSTFTLDDAVDFTWKNVCHEIMHTYFHRLHNMGIPIVDPMDSMLVNGVMTPYYKNDQPYAPDGNFAEAFRRLKSYWHLLFPPKEDVVIKREKDTGKETTGSLTAIKGGATFTCKTLELPWKNNAANISCIPPGMYDVEWTYSLRFLRFTYEIINVPNRTGIRLHPSNYFTELNGCLALGSGHADINHDGELDVTNSRKTLAAFEALMQKKSFRLKVEQL